MLIELPQNNGYIVYKIVYGIDIYKSVTEGEFPYIMEIKFVPEHSRPGGEGCSNIFNKKIAYRDEQVRNRDVKKFVEDINKNYPMEVV